MAYNKEKWKEYHAANKDRRNAQSKAWREANPEKFKASKTKYRKANPEKFQDYQLRYRFGISLSQYNGMCDRQGFLCPICNGVLEDETTGQGKTLYVDHDHDTDTVRSLLCDNCNKGLGQFNDRPERLIAAAAYLLKHKKSLFPV